MSATVLPPLSERAIAAIRAEAISHTQANDVYEFLDIATPAALESLLDREEIGAVEAFWDAFRLDGASPDINLGRAIEAAFALPFPEFTHSDDEILAGPDGDVFREAITLRVRGAELSAEADRLLASLDPEGDTEAYDLLAHKIHTLARGYRPLYVALLKRTIFEMYEPPAPTPPEEAPQAEAERPTLAQTVAEARMQVGMNTDANAKEILKEFQDTLAADTVIGAIHYEYKTSEILEPTARKVAKGLLRAGIPEVTLLRGETPGHVRLQIWTARPPAGHRAEKWRHIANESAGLILTAVNTILFGTLLALLVGRVLGLN